MSLNSKREETQPWKMHPPLQATGGKASVDITRETNKQTQYAPKILPPVLALLALLLWLRHYLPAIITKMWVFGTYFWGITLYGSLHSCKASEQEHWQVILDYLVKEVWIANCLGAQRWCLPLRQRADLPPDRCKKYNITLQGKSRAGLLAAP